MIERNIFKVDFVLGTRPEAIKLAPLIQKFKKSSKFKVKIILSGQHDEMIEQVMEVFNLKADIDFRLLQTCNSINELSSKIIRELGVIFSSDIPDLVFVQGDTSTALSGGLAAFFSKIPIAHIEAGLRTNNLFSPFPEEANRRIISQIATLHFAPTKLAVQNLRNYGISKNVYLSGNTVIDALNQFKNLEKINTLKKLNIEKGKYILITVHRRENWGESIKKISQSILDILEKNKDLKFVFPCHKNPLIRNSFKEFLSFNKNVLLIEPLPYLEFIYLMKFARIVLTDSGGIQEEAATLGKPTIILRDSTERPEVLDKGNAVLAGNDPKKIASFANSIMLDEFKYESMSRKIDDFGKGESSAYIYKKIFEFLNYKIKKI